MLRCRRMASSPQPTHERAQRHGLPRDSVLLMWLAFTVVTVIIAFVATMMYWSTALQMKMYERGIETAMTGTVNQSAAITYSRALTYAVTKTASEFLAFMLIFLGGIYVLMPREVSYGVTVEGKGAKGSLESNSPGLIMMTLGVVLAIASLWIQSNLTYAEQRDSPAPAGTDEVQQMQQLAPVPSGKFAKPPSDGSGRKP
jgi:hypothetical protein